MAISRATDSTDENSAESPAVPIDESPAERIARVLRESQGDERAKVALHRAVQGTAKTEWCRDYTPENFESIGYEGLRAEWGPGEYVILVYGMDADNRYFTRKAKSTLNLAAARGVEKSVQSAAPADSALAQILASLADSQRQILEVLTKRPEPVDQMTQMQTMLGVMQSFKSVLAPAESPQKSQISEIVAAVRELRAVSDEINPAKGDTDNPLSMLPQILDTIKTLGIAQRESAPVQPVELPASMIEQYQPAPTPLENPAPAVNAGTFQAAPNPAPKSPAEPAREAVDIQLFKSKLDEMIALAGKGDIQAGAEIGYEFLPDEMIEYARKDTNWFQAVAGFHPEAAPHRAYFESVMRQVLQWIDTPDTPDPEGFPTIDPPPASG